MKKHPHLRSSRRTASLILAGSIAALLAPHSAQAADQTWDGTPLVNGNWSTGSNWSGGAAPGSTSVTNSPDVATFNTAIANTWGNAAGNPVVIDLNRNISSISFTGAAGNYFIGSTGGNALKLSSGGTIQILSGLTATNAIETINAPLALHGTGQSAYSFANNSANGSGAGAGTLNFGGAITGTTGFTTLSLIGSNSNANTISGIIGNGTASNLMVSKFGVGTWALNGANTFTGSANVADGTLSINSIANNGVASPLGLGTTGQINLGGRGSTNNAKLQFTGASGGSSNRSIGLNPNGSSGGGTIENTVAGQTLTLSGNVNCTFGEAVNPSLGLTGAGDGVLSGIVSNSLGRVSLAKSGSGTWTFSGANTYSGDTTVSGGTLKLGNTRALGFGGVQTTTTGATTVNGGFTLDLNGSTDINEPITLIGTGIGGNGALVNNSGTAASIANGIAGLAVPATGIGSGLSAAPSVVISGTGTGATATASLGLTTASITSVSGGTGWVTDDTVLVIGGGSSNAIGTVTASGGAIAAITITSPGRGYTTAPSVIVRQTGTGNTAGVTFVGNATNFTVGGLTMTNAGSGYTGTPTITVGGLGGATATLSSVHLATDSSIGGSGNTTISSAVSGAGLSKVGAGTLTLTGANTYTGNTTVRAGTLKLDDAGNLINTANLIVGDAGSIGARLDVTTKTGGLSIGLAQTLSGIGQIDGNTIVLGTHAPGNSPGLQTFNGNLAYSTGSMLKWELATNSVGTRGTDFDGIDVIGAGVLSIATNVASNLIFNAVGSTVNWNNVFWQSNHSWLVFDNANLATHDSASIFDTINVSTDSVGATLTGGAFAWAQSGNDVFLNFTATTPVPEPTGVAVGLLCLGVATLRRRRRAAVAAELQA